jgi:hypothetical protein
MQKKVTRNARGTMDDRGEIARGAKNGGQDAKDAVALLESKNQKDRSRGLEMIRNNPAECARAARTVWRSHERVLCFNFIPKEESALFESIAIDGVFADTRLMAVQELKGNRKSLQRVMAGAKDQVVKDLAKEFLGEGGNVQGAATMLAIAAPLQSEARP